MWIALRHILRGVVIIKKGKQIYKTSDDDEDIVGMRMEGVGRVAVEQDRDSRQQ